MRGSCEAHCSLYLFFTQLIESVSGSRQVISRLLRIAVWLLTVVVTESECLVTLELMFFTADSRSHGECLVTLELMFCTSRSSRTLISKFERSLCRTSALVIKTTYNFRCCFWVLRCKVSCPGVGRDVKARGAKPWADMRISLFVARQYWALNTNWETSYKKAV